MERASVERDSDDLASGEKRKSAESGEHALQSRASSLLGVQSSAGNAATIALLQRRGLEVGAADDPAEREADAVAAQVMAALQTGHDDESATSHPAAGAVQRRTVADLSSAPGHGAAGGTADPEVASAIEAARGRGGSLPSSVRGPIESAMGADLGGVRIHADAQADRLNRSLNAEAFTTGNDIFFRKGAYQPGTSAGTELLSHELAHVVQQSGGARRKLRRSLVRDRVFSDVEFLQGVGGQTEGGQFDTIVTQLKKLEGLHDNLDSTLKKVNGDDTFEQRFSGKQNNMKHLVKTADEIVAGIPHVISNAERYIADHEESTSGFGGKVKGLFTRKKTKQAKAGRVEQVQTLLIQLRRRREQLKVQAEKWRVELLTMKKAGIEAEKESKNQRSEAMDEARHGTFGMYKGRVNNAKFGAGAMGSVAQVDYKDEKGELFKGVFKAEPEKMPDNDGGMLGLGTSEESPNFSLRAVAASRLNELLGMKVIPKTELAFHEQFGFGQVMALAGGKSPRTQVKIEIEEADEEKIAKIEQVLKEEERKFGPKSKVVRSKSESGEVKAFLEETVTYETDWDHPILKRELANLQLMDALIGNIDRHCENYFIQVDAFGNPIGVLGIDNDLTFAQDKNDPSEVSFFQGHHAGMPPAVDAHTAEKFCAVTEAQVRKTVQGLLNKIEIDTLVVRLKSIQARLSEKKNGQFVIPRISSDLEGAKQWTELKDPEKHRGAYFSRERKWQQGDMKEAGRLLKPDHALLYKEERLAQIIKQVEAKQGS
jgi:hypothetical protein